jgi:hypothetical protein
VKYCKACGEVLARTPRTDFLLREICTLTEWPEWLEGICVTCIHDIRKEEDVPLVEKDLVWFLTGKLSELAARHKAGLSIIRCEVFESSMYMGEHAARCRRYTSKDVDGRGVCGPHSLTLRRGKHLTFVADPQPDPVRAFVVWAGTRSELTEQLEMLANTLPV